MTSKTRDNTSYLSVLNKLINVSGNWQTLRKRCWENLGNFAETMKLAGGILDRIWGSDLKDLKQSHRAVYWKSRLSAKVSIAFQSMRVYSRISCCIWVTSGGLHVMGHCQPVLMWCTSTEFVNCLFGWHTQNGFLQDSLLTAWKVS